MHTDPDLITIEQTVELLGRRVSAGTLNNWRAETSRVKGPDFTIVKGRVLYVRSSVERFAREYPFRKRAAAAGRARVALVALLLLPMCFAGGLACKGAKQVLRLPERSFVEGERAVHDFLAPRFEKYVEADPNLTEAEKAAFGKTIDDWELALKLAEDAVEDAQ